MLARQIRIHAQNADFDIDIEFESTGDDAQASMTFTNSNYMLKKATMKRSKFTLEFVDRRNDHMLTIFKTI